MEGGGGMGRVRNPARSRSLDGYDRAAATPRARAREMSRERETEVGARAAAQNEASAPCRAQAAAGRASESAPKTSRRRHLQAPRVRRRATPALDRPRNGRARAGSGGGEAKEGRGTAAKKEAEEIGQRTLRREPGDHVGDLGVDGHLCQRTVVRLGCWCWVGVCGYWGGGGAGYVRGLAGRGRGEARRVCRSNEEGKATRCAAFPTTQHPKSREPAAARASTPG